MKTEEEVKFEVGYILGELEKSLEEGTARRFLRLKHLVFNLRNEGGICEPKTYDYHEEVDEQKLDLPLQKRYIDMIECVKCFFTGFLNGENTLDDATNMYGNVLFRVQDVCMNRETFKPYNIRNKWYISRTFNFAFPMVYKCGSSTLRNIVAKYDGGITIDEDDTPQKGTFTLLINNGNVVFDNGKIPEGPLRFAVYRDPIERFQSALNNCHYGVELAIKLIKQDERLFGFVKDGHLRRQVDLYNVNDVDYVVKLEDLDDFLELVVGYHGKKMHSYRSSLKWNLDVFWYDDAERKFIKEYYKPDYKILDSEKVWKNPRRS